MEQFSNNIEVKSDCIVIECDMMNEDQSDPAADFKAALAMFLKQQATKA